MSDTVLLSLLNESRKRDKLRALYLFFPTILINPIFTRARILIITRHSKYFEIALLACKAQYFAIYDRHCITLLNV